MHTQKHTHKTSFWHFSCPEIQRGCDPSESPADCGRKPQSAEHRCYLGSVCVTWLILMSVHINSINVKFQRAVTVYFFAIFRPLFSSAVSSSTVKMKEATLVLVKQRKMRTWWWDLLLFTSTLRLKVIDRHPNFNLNPPQNDSFEFDVKIVFSVNLLSGDFRECSSTVPGPRVEEWPVRGRRTPTSILHAWRDLFCF